MANWPLCFGAQSPSHESDSGFESVADYRSLAPDPDDCDVTSTDLEEMDDYDDMNETEKRMTVKIQDSHDIAGEGMLFDIQYTTSFKHIFDAFKAASCKKCRDGSAIRFKLDTTRVRHNDSPSKLKIRSVKSISIRAYSNCPGLRCGNCQTSGYPSTHGATLNGDQVVSSGFEKQNRKVHYRILFQDSNGNIRRVLVNRYYKFRTAKASYAKQLKCDAKTLHFFFEGETITDEDTADELGMKDNSVVDVHMHMMGA